MLFTLTDFNQNCKKYFSGSTTTVCSTKAATETEATKNIAIVEMPGLSGYARSVLPERSLSSIYRANNKFPFGACFCSRAWKVI